MGTLEVRVAPRSGRTGVDIDDGGVAIRVRAAPERGRATEEALRLLAEALSIPRGDVRLRTGARSRRKLVEVEGLTREEALERLSRR
jgi:uncharacterized protein YggU (UPF0235/DUF167 family)